MRQKHEALTEQDIQTLRQPCKKGRRPKYIGCAACGNEPHYALGLGRRCYDKLRKREERGSKVDIDYQREIDP